MAGWTTSSAEKGGRTGLGEGERDDGADMAGRFGIDRLGLREWEWRGLVLIEYGVLRTRDDNGNENENESDERRTTDDRRLESDGPTR